MFCNIFLVCLTVWSGFFPPLYNRRWFQKWEACPGFNNKLKDIWGNSFLIPSWCLLRGHKDFLISSLQVFLFMIVPLCWICRVISKALHISSNEVSAPWGSFCRTHRRPVGLWGAGSRHRVYSQQGRTRILEVAPLSSERSPAIPLLGFHCHGHPKFPVSCHVAWTLS